MKKFALTVWALVGIMFLLNGCFTGSSSATAASTISLAHMFNTLKVPHATADVAEVIHPHKAGFAGFIQEAEAAVTIGTNTGCPTLVAVHSQSYDIITCQGVRVSIGEAPTANDLSNELPPQGDYQVFFDGPNCTGNAYTDESQGLGGTQLVQGDAFFMDISGQGLSDTNNYWWVAPGATLSGAVNVLSLYNGTCQATSATLSGLYPVTHQDATASGWPTAPVPGPVSIGPAGS